MKKTLLLFALLTAPAFAAAIELDLLAMPGSSLTSATGVQIGGSNNTGTASENSAITTSASYADLSGVITTDLKWYADKNYSNVGEGINPVANTVTLVTDGPAPTTNHLSAAAFSYTLSDNVISMLEENTSITLTLNVKVSGGNNNNKQQGISAQLMSALGVSDKATYGNANGTSTDPATLTLTLGQDTVNSMIAAGTAQKLIVLIADTNNVTGTNEAWQISSMKLSYVPEPATATLSLLALAGLAARRRRH